MLEVDSSSPTKRVIRIYPLKGGHLCGMMSNSKGKVFYKAQFFRKEEFLIGKYLVGTWCTHILS